MIRYPLHLERQYAARLLRRLRFARILVTERAHRQDNDQDDLARRAGLSIGATRRAFEVTLPITESSLLPTAQATDAFTTRAVTRAVSQLVAVDVEADNRIGSRSAGEMRDLHRSWARENVSLITSMEADTFDDLADHVAAAVAEGRTDLAQVIQDRFGVAENRAKLIARDQIGSLNGQITEARQTQLGIEAYEWSSSGDQRVRPLHRRLDGTIRRWDDPHPTEIHPGRAIQCRCVAIPVLDDVPPAAPTARPSPTPLAPRPPTTRSSTGPVPPPRSIPRFIPAPPPTPMRPGLIQARRAAPPTPPTIPPSSGLPAGLPVPPVNPALDPRRTAIRPVEKEIRLHHDEHCATQLSAGTVLRSGPEYSDDYGIRDTRVALQVPIEHIAEMLSDGAAIFTHNHPSPSTFSWQDIRFAADANLIEVRATHPAGGAWVVRRPDSGWPKSEAIQESLDEAGREGLKRAMLLMDQHIIDSGGDPRDERAAKGWSEELFDRLGDDEYNVAIRDALGQLGLPLEFDP